MCKYCGNKSGLKDARGNCVTCGAPTPKTRIENCMTINEMRQYMGLATIKTELGKKLMPKLGGKR